MRYPRLAARSACLLAGILASLNAQAFPTDLDQCLLEQLKAAPDEATVAELKAICLESLLPLAEQEADTPAATVEAPTPAAEENAAAETGASPLETRITLERATAENPFVITPHRPNYLLPATYNFSPNSDPFDVSEGELQKWEFKFQLSFKFPLVRGLFNDRSSIFLAYTNQSYWQAYNREFSSAFRETNHEPELFLTYLPDYSLFGIDARLLQVGLSHQSNGRGGVLSRSWNRLYADLVFERGNFAFSLKPWYRIPEPKKKSPTDATGDDNPDIEDFMGYGELRLAYKLDGHSLSLMLRSNLSRSDPRGAVELGWSFPLTRRVKGYAQYFDGYGESLIDYDAHIRRIGIGIALTDWL
ncbi:phospholipase A [Thiohalobacter thiocyanaticus]|uniref:Phospholipase A1 n=1 Tax=Thiohalobacter thiocyanaticus TaxID=585455 RepID=A0A426QJX8_9GAMM|nr:phospholipase A [Thiohalobacter thiocyanaticus]RRQ22063.1 phospholipase [Thiohalobacter thiocyanaticus]